MNFFEISYAWRTSFFKNGHSVSGALTVLKA